MAKEFERCKYANECEAECNTAIENTEICDSFQLFEKLKRKEQECDKLKAEKEYYKTWYRAKHSDVENELGKLKAENERLQLDNERLRTDLSNYNEPVEKLLYTQKQALKEIVEIARMRTAGYVPSVVAKNTYEINMDKILSIIAKAKGEE